ncbi:hypothetical protein CYG49_00530 [Candidatus Saccharibacteria bacterium]|nr:MAG: hypothetical protein CYG49_00530 [Candidatus Saccharibacteria bacterium]
MVLFLHVSIAVASLLSATYVLLLPSNRALEISQVLIGLTIGSGTLLVLLSPAYLIQACISGTVYALFALLMTIVAHKRLASVHIAANKE